MGSHVKISTTITEGKATSYEIKNSTRLPGLSVQVNPSTLKIHGWLASQPSINHPGYGIGMTMRFEIQVKNIHGQGSNWIPFSIFPTETPPIISYPGIIYVIWGNTITEVVPTFSGIPTSWSISPSLPGLNFNTSTGIISGAAWKPSSFGYQSHYTITATNSTGGVSAGMQIALHINDKVPILRTIANKSFTWGTTIQNINPTYTSYGGTPTSWNITPGAASGANPQVSLRYPSVGSYGTLSGLILNTADGTISGTPNEPGTYPLVMTYTVTASNTGGTSSGVSFTITINDKLLYLYSFSAPWRDIRVNAGSGAKISTLIEGGKATGYEIEGNTVIPGYTITITPANDGPQGQGRQSICLDGMFPTHTSQYWSGFSFGVKKEFRIRVKNSAGNSGWQPFSITVDPPPVIIQPPSLQLTHGEKKFIKYEQVFYDLGLTQTGGVVVTWKTFKEGYTGQIPSHSANSIADIGYGLQLNFSNGTISGRADSQIDRTYWMITSYNSEGDQSNLVLFYITIRDNVVLASGFTSIAIGTNKVYGLKSQQVHELIYTKSTNVITPVAKGGNMRFASITTVGDDVFGLVNTGHVYKIEATTTTTRGPTTAVFNKIVGGNTKLYGIGTDKVVYSIEQNAIVAMGDTWRFNDIAVVGDDVFGIVDNGNVYKIGATVATSPIWGRKVTWWVYMWVWVDGEFDKIVGGNTKLYGTGRANNTIAYFIQQSDVQSYGGNWRFKDIAVVGDVLYGLSTDGTEIYKVTGIDESPTPFDEAFATLPASCDHIIGGRNSLYAYNDSNAYRINVPN